MSDQIKEAFSKVKEDIKSLEDYLNYIISEIALLRTELEGLKNLKNQQQNKEKSTPTSERITPAETLQRPAEEISPQNKTPFQASKPPNTDISIGNRGVPADRQTNQQTDRQTEKSTQSTEERQTGSIQKVSEILDSLDVLKKEIRAQIKKLTRQEMLIFTLIYQLEEQGHDVDYSLLASKSKLTESSIRDYTQKLLKKGAPLEKTKENNKKVTLKINQGFKKIAPLNLLLTLQNH